MPHPVSGSHRQIIDCMQAFGYRANASGVCFGVGEMGMQAILSKRIADFNEHLLQVGNLMAENGLIGSVIKEIEAESKSKAEEKKTGEEKTESVVRSEEEIRQIRERVAKKLAVLSKEEQAKLVDIRAFFEGVEIYMNVKEYSHLFPDEKGAPKIQNTIRTLPLVQSQALEKAGGAVKISSFIGSYDEKELCIYLNNISKHIKKTISININTAGHTINVGYDPDTRKWTFIDANSPPAMETTDYTVIAGKVINAISAKGQCALFGTSIYTTKQDEAIIQKNFLDCQNEKEWKNIHTLTRDRINRRDAYSNTLLYMAAAEGDAKLTKELLSNGADPKDRESHGNTPLYVAIARRHYDVVKEILDKNPELVNKPCSVSEKMTVFPLFTSLLTSDPVMMDLVLSYDPYPDQTLDRGDILTPINYAENEMKDNNALLIKLQEAKKIQWKKYIEEVKQLSEMKSPPDSKRDTALEKLNSNTSGSKTLQELNDMTLKPFKELDDMARHVLILANQYAQRYPDIARELHTAVDNAYTAYAKAEKWTYDEALAARTLENEVKKYQERVQSNYEKSFRMGKLGAKVFGVFGKKCEFADKLKEVSNQTKKMSY